jgi:RimJ/RimL family protein N-acetyltransferase
VDVTLRPWATDDAAALRLAVATSPDLRSQFGDTDLSTITACAGFIDRQLGGRPPQGQDLAIAVDGRVAGNVGLSNVDRQHDTARVYYWVAVEFRGRGLATCALAAMSAWAFDSGELFRLELGHRVNNPASCAVATGAGFRAEGVARAKLRYGDQRFDVETHARLATDPAPSVPLLPLVEVT